MDRLSKPPRFFVQTTVLSVSTRLDLCTLQAVVSGVKPKWRDICRLSPSLVLAFSCHLTPNPLCIKGASAGFVLPGIWPRLGAVCFAEFTAPMGCLGCLPWCARRGRTGCDKCAATGECAYFGLLNKVGRASGPRHAAAGSTGCRARRRNAAAGGFVLLLGPKSQAAWRLPRGRACVMMRPAG